MSLWPLGRRSVDESWLTRVLVSPREEEEAVTVDPGFSGGSISFGDVIKNGQRVCATPSP